MQILAIIAALLFLSAGYAYDDEESLLGLPVEYDIFGLDFREALENDRDIFKEESNTYEYERMPDTTLQKLCQEFDLLLDNQNLDCSSLKFVPKVLKVQEHNVQKRDIVEPALDEGSGDDPEEGFGEATKEETEVKLNEVPEKQAEETPKESEIEQENTEAVVPTEAPKEEAEAEDSPAAKESAPEAVTPETPIGEERVSEVHPHTQVVPQAVSTVEAVPEAVPSDVLDETAKEKVVSEAPSSEGPVEKVVPAELPSEAPKEEAVEPQPTEQTVENNSEVPSGLDPGQLTEEQEVVTEGIIVKEEIAPLGVVPKKGRKLTSGLSEGDKPVTDAVPLAEADKSDTEKLNEHQSGVAIIESAGSNSGTLEASDNAVKHMATNAEIKETSSNTRAEDPKSGESAKDTQEGRKDTKVLIILFVAVVVVGAAAFAYNFIKKRKAKKAEEAARSENGGNALQRSFQNISSKEKNDPEHGTELKPLMKTGEKPIVEYKDEKGNGKTEG